MVDAFRINGVVLHGIKKAGPKDEVEPELSEAEAQLSGPVRGFIQEQIRAALKSGRQIIEEPGMSDLGDHVRSFWAGGRSLLDCSVSLAINLQRSQPQQSPEGLLLVADVTLGVERRAFLIAKLEYEKGTQAKRGVDANGKSIYSMNFLDDLFLTTGSKVFKIGYFPFSERGQQELDGLVVDRQAQGHEVARYFREAYLGCVWKERPELATQRFVETVQNWIDRLEDPQKRTRYTVDLLSDLQSPHTGLSISTFANMHLDPSDRDEFMREVRQTLPATEIPKDLSLVSSKMNNIRIETRNGAVVIAPPGAMKNGIVKVETASSESSLSKIIVTDEIDKTGGTGKFKAAQ